jgi:hypothetical protein
MRGACARTSHVSLCVHEYGRRSKLAREVRFGRYVFERDELVRLRALKFHYLTYDVADVGKDSQ